MRQVFRPIIAIGLGYTLCIMAIIESFDAGAAPEWFLSFAIPIVSGLLIERAVRKSRHPEETE